MRFLVDQNANREIPRTLSALYAKHDFAHAYDQGWGALEDVELFETMRDNHYDALVTRDLRQLANPTERQALRDCGLHWIGYNSPRQAGLLGIALETATVLAGLPFFFSHDREAPMAFRLKGVNAQSGQRLTITPL